MQRLRKFIPIVLGLAVIAFGGVAIARFDNSPVQGQLDTQTSTGQPKPSNVKQETNNTQTGEETEPCKKTVSANISNTPPNSTNEVHTEVHCSITTQNGTSSVNVTNNSSQTSTTGSTTGQSGDVSNSTSSNTYVNTQ